ncbi:hypothetical protein NDU88_006747 [Pleurodeles waltl]|uniref:Uncharacterized protein n=1 Tax=Pleurodeles waltl TaxID=8319 RepID=A0AAV7UQX5_PLEWA|nr:hypothetical protein NDU88_006747 [Pleurodeles waltl]
MLSRQFSVRSGRALTWVLRLQSGLSCADGVGLESPRGRGAAKAGRPYGPSEGGGPGARLPGAQGLGGGCRSGCGLLTAVPSGRSPGTPDLVWQGPLDFEEDDPGEQDAARTPWDEAKAGPGSASRMSSAGQRGRRQAAADASSGRCGGVGFAPPMPRPGRSNVRALQGCGRRAEGSIQVVRCVVAVVRMTRGAVARDEVESDMSLEEGELHNSGSEAEWWERKGRGGFNPVRKSLQAEHVVRRPGGRLKERVGGEARKVQERPLLLSPGKASSCSMVSVASEAREDSVRLVKGVYVQDTGVATDSGASGELSKEVRTSGVRARGANLPVIELINAQLLTLPVGHFRIIAGDFNSNFKLLGVGASLLGGTVGGGEANNEDGVWAIPTLSLSLIQKWSSDVLQINPITLDNCLHACNGRARSDKEEKNTYN